MLTHTQCGQNGLFLSADEDRAFGYHNSETDRGDPMEAYWEKNLPHHKPPRTGRGSKRNTAVTRLKSNRLSPDAAIFEYTINLTYSRPPIIRTI